MDNLRKINSQNEIILPNAQILAEILDFAHLAKYTGGDRALETELLGLFKDQAILQFDQIQSAKNENDWVMAVHTLKGAALGIGAVEISKQVRSLEDLGYLSPNDKQIVVVEQLGAAVNKCVAHIEILLGRSG